MIIYTNEDLYLRLTISYKRVALYEIKEGCQTIIPKTIAPLDYTKPLCLKRFPRRRCLSCRCSDSLGNVPAESDHCSRPTTSVSYLPEEQRLCAPELSSSNISSSLHICKIECQGQFVRFE